MHIKEEFYFWRVSADLMINHSFEILKLDEKNKEIWLKKTINKTSHVVRILHKTFDWSNHLKRDISNVMYRVRKIKKHFPNKNIQVHNIYIASLPPVGDWEEAIQPFQIKDRKIINVSTYYASEDKRLTNISLLYDALNIQQVGIRPPESIEEIPGIVHYLKQAMFTKHEKEKNEMKSVFNFGKPFLTYILLILNILIFALIEWKGSSTDTLLLIEMGAKYNPYIVEGEWWRIISSMFLHIGYLHIIMNMIALYYLGKLVEQIFGSFRFLTIYIIAGIIGGLSSFALNPQIAAGASGAIFGLFGALLFFGINYKKIFFKTMGSNVIFVLIFNIIFGFSVPQIDNGAHIGGLIGGFLAATIVHVPKKKSKRVQLTGIIATSCVLIGLYVFGINHSQNHYNSEIEVNLSYQLIMQEKFEEAHLMLTRAIEHIDIKNEKLFVNRAYASIKLKNYQDALTDLKTAIELNPSLAEAHYLLAAVYGDLGENKKALEEAQKALNLKPSDEAYQELIDKLRRREILN